MEELIRKARAIQNTIGTLVVPATYDTMNRLLGIYQVLEEMIGEMEAKEAGQNAADPE